MPPSQPIRPLQAYLVAAALLSSAPVSAESLSDRQQMAGDYFVGASVFLFERTVLAAFLPPEIRGTEGADAVLDAGAIVLTREKADAESGAAALQAILGWLKAWLSLDQKTPESPAPPGFDPERRHSLTCLAYGADPEASTALADDIALSSDERGACIARYEEARKQWTQWLQPFRRTAEAAAEDAPALRLAFAPTMDDADQAIADALRENGIFQVLTDDLNAALAMPQPMTALLTQCGEARAFYNPDRGEAVLCYELLGALLRAAP